jgi:hypothetical protein
VDPERVGQVEPVAAWPTVGIVGGSAVALVSVVLAAVAGSPYLSFSSLNPWIAVFAVSSFVALFAVPFAVNQRIVARDPERAEAWERAMMVWGAVALGVLAFALVLIFAGSFSPGDALADAVGLLIAIETGLVLATLLAWLLSG